MTLLPAYSPLAPFAVVIVALDDDPILRYVGNVVAEPGAPINSIDPHSIRIGEAVRVTFETVGDVALPRWIRA